MREMIQERDVTQSLVSLRTGKPPSNVAHSLNCSTNLTMHTIADLAWACHMRPVLSFELIEGEETEEDVDQDTAEQA